MFLTREQWTELTYPAQWEKAGVFNGEMVIQKVM